MKQIFLFLDFNWEEILLYSTMTNPFVICSVSQAKLHSVKQRVKELTQMYLVDDSPAKIAQNDFSHVTITLLDTEDAPRSAYLRTKFLKLFITLHTIESLGPCSVTFLCPPELEDVTKALGNLFSVDIVPVVEIPQTVLDEEYVRQVKPHLYSVDCMFPDIQQKKNRIRLLFCGVCPGCISRREFLKKYSLEECSSVKYELSGETVAELLEK